MIILRFKLIIIFIFLAINFLKISYMYLTQILFKNLIYNKITLFMVKSSLFYIII